MISHPFIKKNLLTKNWQAYIFRLFTLILSINFIFKVLFILFIYFSDSPRSGRSGDRIPVGARFSPPVQTGPGAYPASYPMGTGSFPGVKRQGRGVDHPLPSSAEVKERVELYLYSPYGPSWPVLGWTLPLPLLTFFEDFCKRMRSHALLQSTVFIIVLQR
jgi:hypothetical protein